MIKDVRKEIFKTADHFTRCVRKKDWLSAKADYDNARAVAVFIKLPETDMIELFGDQENEIQGLFPLEMVQQVFYETVVKGNSDWKNRSFEEFRRGLQAGALSLTRWHQG